MQEILIDFDVFKALTARRINENHSYNDVIRELLGLDSVVEPMSASEVLLEGVSDPFSKPLSLTIFAPAGFSHRDLFLPNGTALKAIYKQKLYTAKIVDGKWVNASGNTHASPSAAANEVTGTNVNGLRFWSAKRPSDTDWYRLDLLK